MVPTVEFGVLGPVVLRYEGAVVTPTSATQRALLGVLLLAENRPLSAERLAAVLRPEESLIDARAWVQVVVSRLRTWLAKATGNVVTVARRTDGYLVQTPDGSVDLGRFRGLHAAAADADAATQVELWEEALGLWRGHVLADVADSLHDDTLTVHIEGLRVAAVLGLAEAALATGQAHRTLAQVTELSAEYELDERLHAARALLLAGCGRQSEALQLIERTRDRLAGELGVDLGEHLRDAHLRVLRQQAIPPAPVLRSTPPATRWRGPRPDVTAVIGRDDDRAAVTDALGGRRLVTITGPGGCGKTTLAAHVAEKIEAQFTDGVVVVALASLCTLDDIVTALASLLDVSAPTIDQTRVALAHALAGRHLLVVLDNCEHVIADCAELIRHLTGQAPRLSVLATSRQPLGITEEWVWPLNTLPEQAAVELFLLRAVEAVPTLRLTDTDRALAATVCRRLDGLPLAIELAAARLRALSVAQLAARLERDLMFLGRTTLHATIDWSYRLLTESEQRLLARLSIFRGSFSLDSVEAVCGDGDGDDVLSDLITLVERSLLLTRDCGAERRYQLLATVRAFAADRLADHGAVLDRLLDHWLEVGREIDAVPHYRDRMARAQSLADDGENIRAALDHGFSGARACDAAEVVVRLTAFWLANRAFLGASERRLSQAAEHAARCTPEVRSLILYRSAIQPALREDYVGARDRMEELLPEIAEHRPREYREGTISLVTASRFALNPVALERVPAMLAAVPETVDGDEPSTALTVAAGVYGMWGRYPEATEMCARYAARAARRSTRFSLSHQVVRLELALGMGASEEAGAWSRLLTEQLVTAGSPLEQEPARRAIALDLLARNEDEAAVKFLAESVAELERSYAPELARSAHLGVLLAQALRRTGDPEGARDTLVAALSQAVRRTHLRVGFTGVLAAALTAADLGDPAGTELARRWDELRRRIGLPMPVGFADAASVLGIEPGTAGTPDSCWVWRADDVQDVIDRAHRWSVGQGRVPHSPYPA